MNKAILAHKALHTLHHYIQKELTDYFWEEGRGWSDKYMEDWADRICEASDELEPVLEWLEGEII